MYMLKNKNTIKYTIFKKVLSFIQQNTNNEKERLVPIWIYPFEVAVKKKLNSVMFNFRWSNFVSAAGIKLY